MTFHNITGCFGSGQARNVNRNTQNRRRNLKNIQMPRFGELTAERWVDIICMSIISVFVVSVFLNWNTFLDFFC